MNRYARSLPRRTFAAWCALGLVALGGSNAASGQETAPPGAPTIQITHRDAGASRQAPAEHFTGAVRVGSPIPAGPRSGTLGGLVTFEPGARTNWHTHPLGQTLLVTTGSGFVQCWNEPAQAIHAGDTVWIPAGVKHWHGASPTDALTHLAVAEPLDGKPVAWLEPVTEGQYAAATNQKHRSANTMSNEPTPAQKAIGDFSPKLVQLTDEVLFGDVWERPELSKRDRSLVTVTALIAGGNTEQLAHHLQRARDNGVTETELKEAIVHLAFYCGWPRAMSAVKVAKEVFAAQP